MCIRVFYLIIYLIVFYETVYIPRLSNYMKVAVQKTHLGVKFCTEFWTILKKRRLYYVRYKLEDLF